MEPIENRKPFKTIDEQIDLLRSRGMRIDESARLALMRDGYYSIVNGYKSAFLDREATNNAHDDRYIDGTSFDHLHLLYDIDRMMRERTFPVLLRAEHTLKTAVAHCFCEKYPEPDAYLDSSLYCNAMQYFNPRSYERDKSKLLEYLRRAHENQAFPHDSVQHYLDHHRHVPLWVLINVLTFGNVSHFYALQTTSVRNAICKMIAQEQGIAHIAETALRIHFSTLVDYRNVCAHDGRFYRAYSGRNRERSFADMVKAMYVVVGAKETSRYLRDISAIVDTTSPNIEIQEEILQGMRISFRNGMISMPE